MSRESIIQIIPILSLMVAGLAVFVGPLISWHVAKRQMLLSQEIANRQVVGPMRQAWINNLRELLAELLSTSLHYYVARSDDKTDAEYQHIELLRYKVKLMLNPNEDDHRRLEVLVDTIASSVWREGPNKEFEESHTAALDLSRQIFKREWNRVKDRIEEPN